MAGDSENQIPLRETMKIYENSGAKMKKLHLFKGGKHEDFYDKYTEEYKTEIIRFINQINNSYLTPRN